MTIAVGIVGYGYWGPNLVRNFSTSTSGTRIVAIADTRGAARHAAARAHPGVAIFSDASELFARPDVDAVVIATPVSTHHQLSAGALRHGKHVLVEKPMCANAEEALDLIDRADRAGRVLMVDHTFLFTGAVQAMVDVIRRDQLGPICYFDSTRVNLGLFQPDVNCLWDLAPHDLSIIDHLVDSKIVHVEATGYCHVDPLRPDMVFLTLHYTNNSCAHFNLSWMSPVKIRRFTVGGTRKMLIWDDLDQDQKIKIYDHGIDFQPEGQRESIIPNYRIGDIYSPQISRKEALSGVVDHFACVIRGETASVMDGARGLRVIRVLEAAQKELTRNLRTIADKRQSSVWGAVS